MKTTLFKTLGLALFISQLSFAAALLTDEGVFVNDPQKLKLPYLGSIKTLTIDHVSSHGYEVYGPNGLKDWLTQQNIDFSEFIKNTEGTSDYPTPEQIEQKIQDIHARYPKLTKIINIGKSSKGRNLLFIKVSKNPEIDETKPEFKYISSMHGDEITGRELMISLLEDMLAAYGKDEKITKLIDNTEIFIMPSMNPDGSSVPRRGNGYGVDLNRNFPDFSTSDNQNNTNGRQIETQNIMKFQASRQFSLSSNFHGGAEVVNYMWDTLEDPHPLSSMLVELSLEYADLVPYMRNSNEFPKGITNGFAWYEVNGGMQDWSYYWHNDLQFTVELSSTKWPDYSDIPEFYTQNKAALIRFMELIHQGAGFSILDNNGNKQSGINGKVYVEQISQTTGAVIKSLGTFGFKEGEFYKVMPVGTYQFTVMPSSSKLTAKTFTVDVTKNKITTNGNFVQIKF